MKLNEIQTKIIEVIQASIKAHESLSLRDIAEQIGVKSANAVLYQLKKLEREGLIRRDEGGKVVGVAVPGIAEALAYLPLLGNAACGMPFEKIEEERMIPAPLGFFRKGLQSKLYVVRAVGDSMAPRIQNGDYIVFERNLSPNSGSVVVARTEIGFTIKVFKEFKDQLVLEPLNKNYPPLIFSKSAPRSDFSIDGVAVGVFKPQENIEEI